ncbi:glycosyltransferase family 2 protein [Paracoccaceae bacterium GXU_MW_L88]
MSETFKSPRITVLMPVHNGEAYLEEAMRSMMTQTFEDFEILVVDDASSDNTPNMLQQFQKEDSRIRVLRSEDNLRITRALNYGLDHARGEYIARMDADDISDPERLAVQIAFMDANPDVYLCGTSVTTIDEHGEKIRASTRTRDDVQCAWLQPFQCALIHPTFFFRRIAHDGTELRYNPEFPMSQDHDFVNRALKLGKVVSLPDNLVKYRSHPAATSRAKLHAQREVSLKICKSFQRDVFPDDVYEELEPYRQAQFLFQPVPAVDIMSGLMAMAEYTSKQHPEYRRWIWRQTSYLALLALRAAGNDKKNLLKAYAREGRAFVWPLFMRRLEIAKIVPTHSNLDHKNRGKAS